VARAPEPSLDSLPSAWSRAWAVVTLASWIAVVVVTAIELPAPIRAPIVIWFVAICPGMALVRLLRLDQPAIEVMLAIALSLSLGGLVPAALLYAGRWSPAWTLAILAAITIGALAADPILVPRRTWGSLRAGLWDRARILAGQPVARELDFESAPALRRRRIVDENPRHAPPVTIVRRLDPPPSPTPTGRGRRRRGSALGTNPLAEPDAPLAMRSALDRVIRDMADRRDAEDG
jgi:hypothetical protein